MVVGLLSNEICVSQWRGTRPLFPKELSEAGKSPLPYPFILCVEGLSSTLSELESGGKIHSCKISQSALKITHLVFAYDNYLFFIADMEECNHIKTCPLQYEGASGQKINFEKSSVMFNPNIREEKKMELYSFLGIPQTNHAERYLGFPTIIGRNKIVIFAYVKEKVRKNISWWNKRLLSRAGKGVLL